MHNAARLEEKAKRILLFAGVAALFFGAVILFFKRLFLPLLPFIIAALISWPVVFFSKKLEKKTRVKKKVWSFLLLLVFFSLIVLTVWLAASKLITELYRFVNEEGLLGARINRLFENVSAFLYRHFPAAAGKIDRAALESRLLDALSEGVTRISIFLAKAAMELPGAVFFCVVSFLAAFYMSVDCDKLKDRFSALLPEKRKSAVRGALEAVKAGLRGYLRAGGSMMLMTFLEVLVGLLIFGVPFPLLLAIVVAAVDFLPVLGTGVILAPMGTLYLFAGDRFRGFGLLALWGATTLAREIVEPRFLGNNLNIHPLFSLFSAYVGLKLFGIPGLIFLPIFAGIFFSVFREYAQKKTM